MFRVCNSKVLPFSLDYELHTDGYNRKLLCLPCLERNDIRTGIFCRIEILHSEEFFYGLFAARSRHRRMSGDQPYMSNWAFYPYIADILCLNVGTFFFSREISPLIFHILQDTASKLQEDNMKTFKRNTKKSLSSLPKTAIWLCFRIIG